MVADDQGILLRIEFIGATPHESTPIEKMLNTDSGSSSGKREAKNRFFSFLCWECNRCI
jgi:hypothetical protein